MFSMQDPHVTDKTPCGCVQLACRWSVGARKTDLLFMSICESIYVHKYEGKIKPFNSFDLFNPQPC